MNKKQLSLLAPHSHKPGTSFSKKLSNIQECEQLQMDIRSTMPETVPEPIYSSEFCVRNRGISKIGHKSVGRKSNHSERVNSSVINTCRSSKKQVKTEHLPQIKPICQIKRNKSALDKILQDRQQYARAYFQQLQAKQTAKKNQLENGVGIRFQFPEIVYGPWKIRGFLKQNYVLLKGVHVDQRVSVKKYEYFKAYEKIRKDYQSWVQSKFNFQI